MVRTRPLALALFVVAAAIVLAVGTGAFSTVSAERTVAVTTAGDDSALLQLTVHTGPNGLYAQQSGSGELEVRLDGALGPSNGVNLNATTTVRNVFNVTNQGSQSVGVWIVKSGANSNLVSFETSGGATLDNSSASAQTLAVGNTIQVTIVIDTSGQSLSAGEVLLDSVTIHADAAQA